MIDLVSDNNASHQPATFKIGVEVGSDKKDGIKVMGTHSIEIPILLTN
ncbi:hypothetical protein KCTCHS21_20030 [Cohnella abietis]|uniref:Uncharacterized protein n=1 Tax=Cohnella abietis TaxID=2507935 RepID=A0A3T1D3E2_9BACL|nr:hypothetical protein KCTCHS21_20030 [Cohnella abietis]